MNKLDSFETVLKRVQNGADRATGRKLPADSHWVTTKEGHHVLVDGKGNVLSQGKASDAIRAKENITTSASRARKDAENALAKATSKAKWIENKPKPKKDMIDLMYVKGVGKGIYNWKTPGIVRLGKDKDVAAYEMGDFKGKVVLYLHGNGECCVDSLWLGKLINKGKYDISLIAPEYRGYGMSGGKFSEQSCYEVARLAYDRLVNERKVAPGNIIILGYSLGSGPAAELATKVNHGGLILQAAYSSGQELLDYFKKYHPSSRIKEANDTTNIFKTAEKLSSHKGRVLMIHGKNDTIVPYAQGKKIFDGIPSANKKLISVRNAGHCDFQHSMGTATVNGEYGREFDYYAGYRKALRDFIGTK